MKNSYHKSQNGMTLVELLVVLVISGIIVSAGYGLYLTQHASWIIQEQISDMQLALLCTNWRLKSEWLDMVCRVV
jgi:prepilin-type N-terminal cleavage/methylation domain-containing protein